MSESPGKVAASKCGRRWYRIRNRRIGNQESRAPTASLTPRAMCNRPYRQRRRSNWPMAAKLVKGKVFRRGLFAKQSQKRWDAESLERTLRLSFPLHAPTVNHPARPAPAFGRQSRTRRPASLPATGNVRRRPPKARNARLKPMPVGVVPEYRRGVLSTIEISSGWLFKNRITFPLSGGAPC